MKKYSIPDKINNILDKNDISVCGEIDCRENECCAELEMYSPEGEDFILTIWFQPNSWSFVRSFYDYAHDFDADDHAAMWVESRGQNGVPGSIKAIVEDAEWIKNKLLEVADELENVI